MKEGSEYPQVLDEFAAIAKLHEGFSISRFGDGELKMMSGAGYVREPANRTLAKEMRSIIDAPHRRCIVGIPTMNPDGPKFPSWDRHRERFIKALSAEQQYYSAFISRPDSAPWIRNVAYARSVEKLWRGKQAVVVCEKDGSALRAVAPAARKTKYIECPRARAYSVIDLIEKAVRDARPDIVILSCGPTATCLANRFAKRGIQAVDFGSGGAFIANLLRAK